MGIAHWRVDRDLDYARTGRLLCRCWEYFSPDERYPEYQYAHLSPSGNAAVYRMVRACLAQAGLDAERFGTSHWNPLGARVPSGSRVFVLANFVQHELPTRRRGDIEGKCTHGSVLRALFDYLLIAVGPNGRVKFGNAPLPNCNWELVLQQTRADKVLEFYRLQGLKVTATDLRIVEPGDWRVRIDLGESSLLEPLYRFGNPRFRVTNYNPDRTMSFHDRRRHVYVLHREVLDADVVFSLPKLKTHEKVGITGALKGCVGAVAEKDCLPHHRFGGSTENGDEYPNDPLRLMRLSSRIHEWVYRSERSTGGKLLRSSDRVLQGFKKRLVPRSRRGVVGKRYCMAHGPRSGPYYPTLARKQAAVETCSRASGAG